MAESYCVHFCDMYPMVAWGGGCPWWHLAGDNIWGV